MRVIVVQAASWFAHAACGHGAGSRVAHGQTSCRGHAWWSLHRSMLLVLAPVILVATATDNLIHVAQRNDCSVDSSDVALVADLEGHGMDERVELPSGKVKAVPMWIPSVAVDGDIVVSGDVTGVLKVWSLATDPAPLSDKCVLTTREHNGSITGLSLKGSRIITASADATIKVWELSLTNLYGDTDHGEVSVSVLRTLSGHNGTVNGIAVWKTTVVSAGADNTVRVWSLLSSELEATLEGHTGPVNNVALRGDTIVSTSDDGTVRVWSVARRACIHTFMEAHSNFAFGVALHRQTAITGGFDRTVKVWNLAKNELSYPLDADVGLMLKIAVDGDAMVVARGPTNDAKLYVYMGADKGWRCAVRLPSGSGTPGHKASVMAAAISGDTVVTAGKDGVVKVWNVLLPDESDFKKVREDL